MNELAASVAVGSDGLCVIPFGNGAERMLKNRDSGNANHWTQPQHPYQRPICVELLWRVLRSPLSMGWKFWRLMV